MPENKKEEKASDKERKEDAEEVTPEDEGREQKERLMRLAAEFDNYKKRVAKEIEGSREVGKASLASKLLPVLDEFQLAMENIDMKTEQGKGMAIVLSNFIDILKKDGLREIENDGTYDPYKHEVLMTKDSEEKEGKIIAVVRKGYTWKDIMLRPASVIVSGGKEGTEETGTKE